MEQRLMGWVRDKKGKVIYRPFLRVANTITTFCARGFKGVEGLENTTMYILEIWDKE